MIQPNDINMLLNEESSGTLIAQASGAGSWQLLPYNCPINPVHAALLRTGKVLFFAGSGNDPNNVDTAENNSAVWDVNAGTFVRSAIPEDDSGFLLDLFCVGHSFLPDGRLMCAGGTLQYDPFYGLPASVIFDPITQQWTKGPAMAAGRWYPTTVTLGDGRVLAVSGLEENGLLETYPSIYSQANGWTYYTQPTSALPMYAHLFLMQNGKVFYSGAYFENTGVSTRILTITTDPITEAPVGGLQDPNSGDQAASVLLPPAQDQKVMIIGGGNGFNGQATRRVNVVNLTATNPTYTAAAQLNFARMHHNAVILPDRTVFVCNGSAQGENGNQATLVPEIYNPATNTWQLAAAAQVVRLYHAVALLLPDGRVIAAGGNPDRNIQERRLEIYSPAYMSRPRPVINSAPGTVAYGGIITIGTLLANNVGIKWVSLIKPMATTHGLDTDQRLVNLPIQAGRTNTSLKATVTTNRNLATPGWYMLFITDNNNVPSVARWIQLV